MEENFPAAVALIMSPRVEGGVSDRASDPGGLTNLGITQATLSRYLGRQATPSEVKGLTPQTAAPIYHALYWRPMRGDELPAGADLLLFDCAINQGEGRAKRILQQALMASLKIDGDIGPATMKALAAAKVQPLIIEIAARRMVAYGTLASMFAEYGLGWSRRLMFILQASLELNEARAPSV